MSAAEQITTDVEQLAQFIELRLLPATGILNRAERIANDAFNDRIGDAMADAVRLPRTALGDSHEAGMELAKITRQVIEGIATDYYDELETDAREWGWIN